MPRGAGQGVLVIPGFLTGDMTTVRLRTFLTRSGYAAEGWGSGINLGPRSKPIQRLKNRVARLSERTGGKVVLAGVSLGGVFAREIAKMMPERVRQVITIGTPFNWTDDHTNVAWLVRLLKGDAASIDEALSARLRKPPMVPTTSLYSRADGVVSWQSCRHGRRRKNVEDVEIEGSHLGMGWNPTVMKVVADRLAQAPRRWRPLQQVA